MVNENCFFCDFCDCCLNCKKCIGCYDCENLVNGFRCSKIKLAKKDPSRYWIFNKEVSKEEWDKRYDLKVIEEWDVCSKCGQPLKKE